MNVSDLMSAEPKIYIGIFFVILILLAVYWLYKRGPPGKKSDSSGSSSDKDEADKLIEQIDSVQGGR